MTYRRQIGISLLCLTFGFGACAKKAPQSTQAAPSTPAVTPAPPAPSAPPAARAERASSDSALSEDDLFARKTLEQLNAERPLADVMFNLDESTLREDARGVLQKNATWLRRWPSTRIVVEGHCDDRGTSEYNLALGERRAAAVKEYLGSLGVEPERVLVITKGEESPFCLDPNEGCWQQNRRGHFVVTAK